MEELDTCGLKCPMPVLKARRELASLSPGARLRVLADDPATVHDFPAFCDMAGHRLLMAREQGGKFVFEIERGNREPD